MKGNIVKLLAIINIVLLLTASSTVMAQVCDDSCVCVDNYYECMNSGNTDNCVNDLLRCLGCGPKPVPEFPTAAVPALLAGLGYLALRIRKY